MLGCSPLANMLPEWAGSQDYSEYAGVNSAEKGSTNQPGLEGLPYAVLKLYSRGS